jgi:hypothetical protein
MKKKKKRWCIHYRYLLQTRIYTTWLGIIFPLKRKGMNLKNIDFTNTALVMENQW